ncbi:MAG: CoA transferase [Solirubrobacteraceae bacterium]|jgi:crotonobetainyl-CoA:carnitine CoA-transferase CaiB-like acyl-CoA transferase
MHSDTSPQPARRPPLEGILVADFSRVLAGPLASMVLGDLGAEVIKVERPGGGDDTRAWGPPWTPDGTSTYFQSVNRNKRSVLLDLADADDLELARALIARADVMIENFRPGTLERLGLGEQAMRAANPRLVSCSLNAFGAGEGAALPGYDLLIQAVGGLMSVTGAPDGPPTKVGVALVDVIAGLFACVAILAALAERERSGLGQRAEVSLLGSLLAGLVNQASGFLGADAVPERLGNRHPSIAPYECFAASDGEFVVAVGNDRQFGSLCRALDCAALAADPRFATNALRVEHREALMEALTPLFAVCSRAELAHSLSEVGVPCGPVNDVREAFALAASLGLGSIVEMAGGVRQVANPISLSATPVSYRAVPPALGADDEALRAWLRGDAGRPGERS